MQAVPQARGADSTLQDGTQAQAAPGRTVLGPTLVMKGDLFVGEDLVIQGTIHGAVVGTDTVTIKRNARLRGKISAATIRLEYGVRLDEVTLTGDISQTAGDY
ncbi:MAG: polymer-forming cytoskeletal protein [Gammaproteobacteria bacterium]|nr:polymer-forming cytoskeletal protein [Gammaproteobacteria bacterium]